MLKRVLAVLCLLGAAAVGLPGNAVADQAIRSLTRDCGVLVGDYAIPGAPTHVVTSEATGAYCTVSGVVEPHINFQLKLPLDNFSGRYLQYGCQGMCGILFDPQFPNTCGSAPGADFAVAATDDGHVGAPSFPFTDGSWAAHDQAARDNYFFRAPHVVSLASKRIITRFYGSGPRHSYFSACSDGGREGLLLAQRYPTDFNGIAVGAPDLIHPLQGIGYAWVSRANTDASGAPIITPAQLQPLHSAVIAACDAVDGLVDGQLEDPRDCHFDPVSIQCPNGTGGPNCLTAAQVDAARKLYRGPVDAQGRRLLPVNETLGSELAWDVFIIPNDTFPVAFARRIADSFLGNVAYPIGTPGTSVDTVPFTVAGFNALRPVAIQGDAANIDLSAFRRAGGKLILWHGLDDQSVPVAGTLDYYARLTDRSGGPRETQRFARLFVIPTMYHCGLVGGGGDKLNNIDPFPALVDWVEHGDAPSRLVAEFLHPDTGAVDRTRPVFPYPLRAHYTGTGSIDDATNFVPAPPPVAPHDRISWVGEDLYTRPGPVAH